MFKLNIEARIVASGFSHECSNFIEDDRTDRHLLKCQAGPDWFLVIDATTAMQLEDQYSYADDWAEEPTPEEWAEYDRLAANELLSEAAQTDPS